MGNRHVERIKAQGLLPSLLYYANSSLLERADVHLLKVYRHPAGAPNDVDGFASRGFEVVTSMEAFGEADREALRSYGTDALLDEFTDFFAMGHRCAIARHEGVLGCVCWMTRETEYVASPSQPCWFVQRCFTLPAVRGQGLYPKTLRFAIASLRKEAPTTPIFIESAIANTGSIRGIEKAGFVSAGIRVRAGKRDEFLPAAGGANHWKQLVKEIMIRTLPRKLLVVRGPVRGNAVYLTFDDGPHPVNTPPLLDLLKKHDVPCTFFVVGGNAQKHPEIVERMHREGHTVGHHSFHHAPPADISAGELMNEVHMTRDVLEPIVGRQPHVMFRPPEGKMTPQKLLRLWLGKNTVVLWNVDPKDGDLHTADDFRSWFAENPLRAGDIVLLHDDVPMALQALPDVIAGARARGLEFRALDKSDLS